MTDLSDPDAPADPAAPMHRLPALGLGGGFDLLAGTRVLDLTTSLAGPYACLLLADMGADVIKLERPGTGDDARAWGPPFNDGESLWFQSVNRNKQSMTLDYTKPAGRAVLHDLVRHSDVVVTNQIRRTQEKLGTDYDSLAAVKPDLIFVSISGFGLSGARADWPGYDLIAEGYSGVMDMTGEPENDPQKVGGPAADMLGGMDGAYAALAALADRQRTGRGHKIDISLVESMTRFMACLLTSHLGTGEVPRRSGGRESVIAIYQVFHTADEPMTLGLGNDNLWQRFCDAVERPDLAKSARYKTNMDRRAVRQELVAEIQKILIEQPRTHWLDLFSAKMVPAGPINRLDQVTADPELIARGLFYRIDQPGASPVPQVNTGIQIDGAANAPRRPPPRLGADNEDILKNLLGHDDAAIARLRDDGVL